MSAFDERLEKPSSTSADAPPPPPSRRSICTQHIEVRRGGVHGMCGSRAPSRAAPERAPKTDPHVERGRRRRRARLLLLRRSASLVACRAARARSGQARGGPSLRAQIPGFNVISGDYPGSEGSNCHGRPTTPLPARLHRAGSARGLLTWYPSSLQVLLDRRSASTRPCTFARRGQGESAWQPSWQLVASAGHQLTLAQMYRVEALRVQLVERCSPHARTIPHIPIPTRRSVEWISSLGR